MRTKIGADVAGFVLEINPDVTDSDWLICTEDFTRRKSEVHYQNITSLCSAN